MCSAEYGAVLSNLKVCGNQYNDPHFAENVDMLIQMSDGTKHQNQSTFSTSYNILEGRRASILGASVHGPYARVSQDTTSKRTMRKLLSVTMSECTEVTVLIIDLPIMHVL